MSVQANSPETLQTPESPLWEPPAPPTDLIFDDGEPLESNRHRVAMNVLIRSLKEAWTDRNDFYTGGNMFIYYSSTQARNRDFRGPDFFAVLDVEGARERQGWVVWEEDGRYPDVIVELMSPSTAQIDIGAKKDLYERVFRTPDYFVYNPFDENSLQGWHLDNTQRYQALVPNEQGWLWCETLGFWLGIWQGNIERETTVWLRFYDADGNLVLLPEEAARLQAEQERLRAEQERLRADQAAEFAEQERLRADQAAEFAEQERLRADQAAEFAEQERLRAHQAAELAEQERLRAERLAARLRELGENLDTL